MRCIMRCNAATLLQSPQTSFSTIIQLVCQAWLFQAHSCIDLKPTLAACAGDLPHEVLLAYDGIVTAAATLCQCGTTLSSW